ncbi:helix-turn-helix transcriptional regulator [Isoptericola croceus]|uniref:helix-turn-helix transcriptional regulator n=1 Tax=Isoptericola croceus TaxID=3031406 RepID=UPI0023F9B2E3|nr:LuxR C-terminal-related transcriptional regulator [Isoptericola croceus]
MARIERLCSAEMRDRPLRAALVEAIGGLVPFDAHVFLLTDPVTCVGASPLASIPGQSFDRLPELIKARYLSRGNRWSTIDGVAALAAAQPRADGDQWWRIVRELGGVDVATLVFADQFGCWGFLDVWRLSGPPFSRPELDRLREIAPIVTRGIRRALAHTFTLAPTSAPHRQPIVLLLDDGLRVHEQTTLTDAWLRILIPTDSDVAPIPAHAYNVAAQLLAREQGVDNHEASARTHLANGFWVSMRAARAESRIVVTIEAATSVERVDMLARTHGLSPRETEVLNLLVSGADTKSIAATLFLSEHTVHDHVRSILTRTGFRTRQLLLAKTLGGAAP